MTDALAGWLYAKGVRVGSTVGIFMEHRAEYALAYIAAHKVSVGENKRANELETPELVDLRPVLAEPTDIRLQLF